MGQGLPRVEPVLERALRLRKEQVGVEHERVELLDVVLHAAQVVPHSPEGLLDRLLHLDHAALADAALWPVARDGRRGEREEVLQLREGRRDDLDRLEGRGVVPVEGAREGVGAVEQR